MFVYMIGMYIVQMPIVQIIHVSLVVDGLMPAVGSMFMLMRLMAVTTHASLLYLFLYI